MGPVDVNIDHDYDDDDGGNIDDGEENYPERRRPNWKDNWLEVKQFSVVVAFSVAVGVADDWDRSHLAIRASSVFGVWKVKMKYKNKNELWMTLNVRYFLDFKLSF